MLSGNTCHNAEDILKNQLFSVVVDNCETACFTLDAILYCSTYSTAYESTLFSPDQIFTLL